MKIELFSRLCLSLNPWVRKNLTVFMKHMQQDPIFCLSLTTRNACWQANPQKIYICHNGLKRHKSTAAVVYYSTLFTLLIWIFWITCGESNNWNELLQSLCLTWWNQQEQKRKQIEKYITCCEMSNKRQASKETMAFLRTAVESCRYNLCLAIVSLCPMHTLHTYKYTCRRI